MMVRSWEGVGKRIMDGFSMLVSLTAPVPLNSRLVKPQIRVRLVNEAFTGLLLCQLCNKRLLVSVVIALFGEFMCDFSLYSAMRSVEFRSKCSWTYNVACI